METISSYGLIITACVIIILSYLFNLLSAKKNIPSVLLLILLGIIINQVLKVTGSNNLDFFPALKILGIIGLIIIVLEAALDLELTREKGTIIWKSFFISLISLLLNVGLIALIINIYIDADFYNSLFYAIPLSIMSSAIVIPCVANISEKKREFMIYESTFSDILGIMFFYFLINNAETESIKEVGLNILGNFGITIIISVIASYLLLILFQKIKTHVKLFLLLSVVILIYSIGESLHLSALIMILIFGLILENKHLFVKGKFLNKLINVDGLSDVLKDFKMVTAETSFLVKTFFFVVFGITITLSALIDIKVIIVSILILLIIYGVRYLIFKLFFKRDIFPESFIAPRGLITLLLFFDIPDEFKTSEFDSGILLFVIVFTSIIMSITLIKSKRHTSISVESEQDIENPKQDIGDTEVITNPTE